MSAHVRRRRSAIALRALAVLTVAFVAASRLAMPTGLADPVQIEPAGEAQISGYVDIPSTGTTRIGFTSSHQARLILDGRIVAETVSGAETAGGVETMSGDVQPGSHRLLLQFASGGRRSADGDPPTLRWQRLSRAPERVPRAALSPRRLSPPAWMLRRALEPAALTLALLWMAAGVSMLVGWMRVLLERRVAKAQERRAIWTLGALCFALYAYPAWWGLPAGWPQDEVVPLGVEGLRTFMTPGWFEKYPPLLTYVLAVFHLPILAASSLDLLAVDDELVYSVMRGTGRVLSAGMAVSAIGAIYLCARRALSHSAALWAAVIAGLCVPLAYYAKTSNPDVPYVFWFAIALIAYQSALLDGAAKHYMVFAAAAACSVTTKDQAYGLFVLPICHLIWARIRQVRATGAGFGALVRDAALPGALAAGLFTFALVYNLPRNWSGFIGHFSTITGLASEGYRMVDSTSLSGQLWLMGRTLHQIEWSLGWPATALTLLGVCVAVRSARRLGRPLLPFALPAVSYYLTFIAVVGYSYDRFVIPICLLLSVFGGLAIETLHRAATRTNAVPGWLVRGAGALLVVYMAARVASVDMLMAADSRHEVRRYMLSSLPADTIVCYVEDLESLPYLGGFRTERTVGPLCGALIVTSKFAERYAPGSPGHAWYEERMRRLGYRVVFRHQGRAPLAILQYEDELRNPDPSFSVLHKVNPEVTVLRPASLN